MAGAVSSTIAYFSPICNEFRNYLNNQYSVSEEENGQIINLKICNL